MLGPWLGRKELRWYLSPVGAVTSLITDVSRYQVYHLLVVRRGADQLCLAQLTQVLLNPDFLITQSHPTSQQNIIH